jgi:hypothetical protein
MQNLTYLFLAQNQFSQNNVPYWIEGLKQLEELSLKSTQRTGPIPDFLGDLKQLILLDLDDNSLMGTIPTKLGLLENLHILLLNRNNLTSTIPTTFSNLKSLSTFRGCLTRCHCCLYSTPDTNVALSLSEQSCCMLKPTTRSKGTWVNCSARTLST